MMIYLALFFVLSDSIPSQSLGAIFKILQIVGLVHLNLLPPIPPLPPPSVFPQTGTEWHSYSTKCVCHLSPAHCRETDDLRAGRHRVE